MRADDLADILALPNGPTNAIRSIAIQTNYGFEPDVNVEFRDSKRGPTVTCDVLGAQPHAHFIASELDEIAARSRTWYTRIALLDFIDVLLGIFLIAFVILTASGFISYFFLASPEEIATSEARFTSFRAHNFTNVIILGVLALVFVGALANRLHTFTRSD